MTRQRYAFTASDITLKELIKLIKMTKYGDFRKIMRKRSEKTVERLESKYEDMELAEKCNLISD